MKTTTQLTALAVAIFLSASSVLAQQPVRRTAAKPAARPYSSASRPATSTTTRPAAAPATARPQQQPTQAQTTAPAQETPVARPAETRPQPVAHSAPARPRTTYSRGHKNVYVNLGLGLATYYGGGFPVGVSVEADVKNNFSVGGSIDYYHYNYYYSSGYNFIYFGARGSYHLGEALNVQSNSFDPYIGASLGFRYAGSGYSDYYYYSGGYNSGVWVGLHLGSRFMFSPKVGAFAEVGYGVSAVKLGLTAKF
ncbi:MULTISPECIES: hypothetical protein [unclassified Spirosoma]|uniref:hypothetical protein n=1 Tax=unclassified Spirosoma TaxID=2621999 RepID=UPI00095E1413|nr:MULTISPECIES: hypothetical protein [unclassified Spirosoma]MBN8823937.1 hypothetical protein [Spirosoma sp.]OJW79671.1 MAG: hypothetical protein BGO59_00005 [Spirosoma sp. 48-14]